MTRIIISGRTTDINFEQKFDRRTFQGIWTLFNTQKINNTNSIGSAYLLALVCLGIVARLYLYKTERKKKKSELSSDMKINKDFIEMKM